MSLHFGVQLQLREDFAVGHERYFFKLQVLGFFYTFFERVVLSLSDLCCFLKCVLEAFFFHLMGYGILFA